MKVYVEVDEGVSLYTVLRQMGFMKSAYCGGRGICGKCRVRINGNDELACLTFGPFKGYVELRDEDLISEGEALDNISIGGRSGFGVAIDLGTTTVEAALFDLSTGKFIKSYKTLNLQCSFGADVVTRIELAKEDYDSERHLLLSTLDFILSQFSEEPDEVVVVSNSVMQHFLLGLPVSNFERYPFKLHEKDEVYTTGRELGIENFSNSMFYIPPPLKNFIGSDFLSNVLYIENGLKTSSFLVCDLGTNAEIGLSNENVSLATSVPAGPAFEGMGLFSGMRAVEGAIYKVFFDGREIKFLTIGDVEPMGLCASAYFDVIKLLKDFRLIDREGTLINANSPFWSKYTRDIDGERAFVLYESDKSLIAVRQSDIRKFLIAKAATYGAVKVLTHGNAISSLFLSGAFGTHIDNSSLRSVKLLPEDLPKARAIGNAALKGASLLLSNRFRDKIKSYRDRFEAIQLATNKAFENAYLEGLEI